MALLKFKSKSIRSLKFIRTRWKNNKTHQGYVCAVTAALRPCRRCSSKVPVDAIIMWRLPCKEVNERVKHSYSKQLANPKQPASCVARPDIVAMRGSLKTRTTERLFLCCYSEDIVPLQNDFHRVLLITNRSSCPKLKTATEANYLFLARDIEHCGVIMLRE